VSVVPNSPMFRIKALMEVAIRSTPKLDGPYPNDLGNYVKSAKKDDVFDVFEQSGNWYRVGPNLWITANTFYVARLP
jgi:hypothetical protein